MKLPIIRGMIDRRLLVNFRVDPEVLAGVLPPPFRPKLIKGYGVAGVCLIRLKHLRPGFLPIQAGASSENAAHRIAVHWEENGEQREGVFIPRRDTSSRLSTLLGGRVFPGEHHLASFQIDESADRYQVVMQSRDGAVMLQVAGRVADQLPSTSIFENLEAASVFFQEGSLGYSARARASEYEGLELRTLSWAVQPLAVERVESTFFASPGRFPPGSVAFDNALLMRQIEHEWHAREPLYLDPSPRRRDARQSAGPGESQALQ